jgi:hypothetical protein
MTKPTDDKPDSCVTLKLEQKGSLFRVVYTTEIEGKREVSKTEWKPRHKVYADASRYHGEWGKHLFRGMGRVPRAFVRAG